MKFYLDEDISPKVAEVLRRKGIDAMSVHDSGMLEASDLKQLEFAAREKRCMVTRNRDDFIKLTFQFLNDHLPHYGVLIIPFTIPGDHFSRMAGLIKTFASDHPEGLESYTIAFLSKK